MAVYCSLGHKNHDAAAFCDVCGERLTGVAPNPVVVASQPAPGPVAAGETQTCPSCGAQNPVNEAFCPECGTNLWATEVLLSPLSQSPPPMQAAVPQPALRIFISHSQEDNPFGLKLVQDLRWALRSESTVWYDASGGLSGGDSWWRKIIHEITTSNIFIVVLSPRAMQSDWVNDEIDTAWRLKNSPTRMRIIPVLHQPCEVRPDLYNLQIVSFAEPRAYQAAFEELLQALHQSPIR
jgi:hypothetical protein